MNTLITSRRATFVGAAAICLATPGTRAELHASIVEIGDSSIALTYVQDAATLQAQSKPQARACHAAVYASALGGTAVFGGARECGRDVLADDTLWLWNGTQWSVLASGGPSPREDALMAYDTKRDALVLYGGRRDGRAHTDTWEWTRQAGWRLIASTANPGALEHASIAFDSVRGRTVLFGGAVGSAFQASAWEWSGAGWAQIATPLSPVARIGHSMTWNASLQSVVLYGGFSPAKQFNDLWRWNGQRWTLVDSIGPTYSEGASLASSNDGIVVVGPGLNDAKTVRAWQFANGRWTERARAQAPAVLVGAAMTYDARRGMFVVTGGGGTADQAIRVAEFDGVSWKIVK